ncbi:MAG: DDE-type integrase/transposase/recombinase [Planctomycetes bacterium]|nr:DDE-type integrase/transposase/recombinase [Planctomycetota bacterium]
MAEALSAQPHHLLKPKRPNPVWPMDLTRFRVLWVKSCIAAILDGFSRKLLALKVYRETPCARNTAALVRSAAAKHGQPKFLVTDHGPQFRKRFGQAMRRQHIRHVQGRVRAPFLNGRLERVFKALKLWMCLVLFGWSVRGIQRKLNRFRVWYNGSRPHSALGCLTPDEAFAGRTLPKPVPYRARDGPKGDIEVHRGHFRGDPHLPVPEIIVRHAV